MTIQVDVLRKEELLPSICGMPLRRGMDEANRRVLLQGRKPSFHAKRRRDQQVSDLSRKERNLEMNPAVMDRLTLGIHVDVKLCAYSAAFVVFAQRRLSGREPCWRSMIAIPVSFRGHCSTASSPSQWSKVWGNIKLGGCANAKSALVYACT
jgi:hypothetical protein